jgi:hypothetical protein
MNPYLKLFSLIVLLSLLVFGVMNWDEKYKTLGNVPCGKIIEAGVLIVLIKMSYNDLQKS